MVRGHHVNLAVTVPDVLELHFELHLRPTIQFRYGDDERFAKERKVITTEYAYTLSRTSDVATSEILSWHWQPNGSYPFSTLTHRARVTWHRELAQIARSDEPRRHRAHRAFRNRTVGSNSVS